MQTLSPETETATEKVTAIMCLQCKCFFSEYFTTFKRCPLCRGQIVIRVLDKPVDIV